MQARTSREHTAILMEGVQNLPTMGMRFIATARMRMAGDILSLTAHASFLFNRLRYTFPESAPT